MPYLSSLAGDGGGIIWLVATDMINATDTLITVKGGKGQAYKKRLGSGGGAGGSIHVITRDIAGNAQIDASGGDGSDWGGGGGSGGRLVAHLLRHFNSTNHLD